MKQYKDDNNKNKSISRWNLNLWPLDLQSDTLLQSQTATYDFFFWKNKTESKLVLDREPKKYSNSSSFSNYSSFAELLQFFHFLYRKLHYNMNKINCFCLCRKIYYVQNQFIFNYVWKWNIYFYRKQKINQFI